MARLQKFVITLTNFTLFAGTVASLSNFASAGEVYLDDTCRQNQRLEEIDRFIVFYKAEFKANSQKHWFSAARSQDGAALFCLSRPNFQQVKPLSNAQEIQFQFIDKIVKAPNNNAVFLITVREGNGSNVPVTIYRLNLNNPKRPVIVRASRR